MVLEREQIKNKLMRSSRRRAKAHAKRERCRCIALFAAGFVIGLILMNLIF